MNETRPKRRWFRLGSKPLILFAVLMILPTVATLRLSQRFDPRWIFGYLLLISVVAFAFYWHDKKRAENDGRRTPESTLHFIEFLGGWPGAFLAQRSIRHKSSKVRYQVIFWVIVAAHQIVCADYIQNWKYLQKALSLLDP